MSSEAAHYWSGSKHQATHRRLWRNFSVTPIAFIEKQNSLPSMNARRSALKLKPPYLL